MAGLTNLSWKQRFEMFAGKTSGDQCWIWTGHIQKTGYGRLRVGRSKCWGAHRASYELHIGRLPDGMIVCHRCDVRACVNPAHLFAGTYKDNMQDAARKGRMDWKPGEKRNLPIGSAHHQAKVTENDVLAMRASTEKGVVLARRYGLSNITVSRIRRRLIWRHVA